MKEKFEEDLCANQARLGLIAVGVMFAGAVALILISQFLDISITFK